MICGIVSSYIVISRDDSNIKKSRKLKVCVAIPDSSLSDEQTLRDKTIKISRLARSFSIFGVNTVYIYKDKKSSTSKIDKKILPLILNYLNTPQYLRKFLYSQIPELQYAGILHPIQTPHHVKKIHVSKIKVGDIRMGIIQRKKISNSSMGEKNQYFINVGLDKPVLFYGNGYNGKIVTAKFISTTPILKAIEAQNKDITQYWGYEIIKLSSLDFLLSTICNSNLGYSESLDRSNQISRNKLTNITLENSTIVLTSKYGTLIQDKELLLRKSISSKEIILIIFGSPKHGLNDFISNNTLSLLTKKSFYLNMFPHQNTETIRLDEAILGTLSILNILKK
ncbi:MAG: putative RNA uridine N3 methyltransferase [Nitrososphaeraceae archaeon]